MNLLQGICRFIVIQANKYQEKSRREKLSEFGLNGEKITKYVELKNIHNIKIGSNTYMNSGMLVAGQKSKIIIGDWCAIGYNVNIKARTHDISKPTGEKKLSIEKDIVIGNNVWIGDNVFIKEGITVGHNVIIGANSVVTKDIEDRYIAAGCLARKIKQITR